MTTPDEDAPVSVRGAGSGRDVVLAVGLLGIGIGGLAAFVKAAPASWDGLPVPPIAALAVLMLGAVLVKRSMAPGRRGVRPPAPGGGGARGAAAPPRPPPPRGGAPPPPPPGRPT
ncbi:hypothetical protein ACFXA3_38830, partial [Streptomyces sp. NPDC059456]